MINDNRNDPKKLWNSINNILHRTPIKIYPDCSSFSKHASSFGPLFIDKISNIMSTFEGPKHTSHINVKPPIVPTSFGKFKEVSELEVRKIIINTPNKQCDSDPWPTSLIKACLDILITPIISIINNSLKEGTFP